MRLCFQWAERGQHGQENTVDLSHLVLQVCLEGYTHFVKETGFLQSAWDSQTGRASLLYQESKENLILQV